jgi:hypothetical protein
MSDTELGVLKIVAGLVATFGGSLGGYILFAKLWAKGIEADVSDVKKNVGDLSAEVDEMKTDVALLKGQGETLRKLDEGVAALHRRIDKHTELETEQRVAIAEKLGALTEAVRAAKA